VEYKVFINKNIMNKPILEEIQRMNLLSKYDTSKTLSEQATPVGKREKNVQDAYKLIVQGSFGFGTNTKKIIDGVNMINNVYELRRLLTLFKDKKTGYDTFDKMIDGEFESGVLGIGSNQNDLNKITAKLKSLGVKFNGNEKVGDKFKSIRFFPIDNPLTDDPEPAPAAAAEAPPSTNKSNWDDVVKYYEGNTDPNWVFDKKVKEVVNNQNYFPEYVIVNSKDTNDTDAFMKIWKQRNAVYIYKKGQGTGTSYGTWEWDGKKPVIKFKDITKNSSGNVQPTDTDWSAITEDNKVIGLYAKGPLVKQVQNKLAYFGYTGETGSPITTNVDGCRSVPEDCDGVYGPSTKAMVIEYQKDNDLSVDGIVGKQTYDAMFDPPSYV